MDSDVDPVNWKKNNLYDLINIKLSRSGYQNIGLGDAAGL